MEQGTTGTRLGNALLKHDLDADTVEAHEFGEGAAVGEGVFVPTSDDAAEDDGYLMAFVYDPERGASDLVILADAGLYRGAIGRRIHLPARVPQGFHGNWITRPLKKASPCNNRPDANCGKDCSQ